MDMDASMKHVALLMVLAGIAGNLITVQTAQAKQAEKLPWCLDPNFHASADGVWEILRNDKSTEGSTKRRDQALAEMRELKAKDHSRYKLRWTPFCTMNKAKALSSREALRLGATEDWGKDQGAKAAKEEDPLEEKLPPEKAKLPFCLNPAFHGRHGVDDSDEDQAYEILRNGKRAGAFIKDREQALAEIKKLRAKDKTRARYKLRWMAKCQWDVQQ
jgi:hypothetical protein